MIKNETLIIQEKISAEGEAESKNITTDALNYSEKRIATQMEQNADMNAEVTKLEGNVEAELAKVLASRRQYEYLNSKLEILKTLSNNPNLKVFGNQQDTALT